MGQGDRKKFLPGSRPRCLFARRRQPLSEGNMPRVHIRALCGIQFCLGLVLFLILIFSLTDGEAGVGIECLGDASVDDIYIAIGKGALHGLKDEVKSV